MHAKWESLPFPFHFLPSVQPDGKAPALQSSSYTHHIWWASCCCRVSRRPRVYQMTLVTKENFYLASWFLDEVHGGSSARARACACVSVDPVACAGVCVESRSASSVFLFLYTMLHFIITFVHWTTPVQKDLRSHHKYHTRWGWGGLLRWWTNFKQNKNHLLYICNWNRFGGFNLLCCCCCRLPFRSHYALILC